MTHVRVDNAREPNTLARRGFVAGLRNAGVNVMMLAIVAKQEIYVLVSEYFFLKKGK
jgi:hypothetical protein